jgi:GTPase SAR1 family protein
MCGDGAVGKTCFLIRTCINAYPVDFIPTVFDNYYDDVYYCGNKYPITLWDLGGGEEYDRLRYVPLIIIIDSNRD